MGSEHEIILYQTDETKVCVSVYYRDETFWMMQKALSELFDCGVDNISIHLKNIYNEKELSEEATVEFFSIVQQEGNRKVTGKNSDTTREFYAFVQNKLHYAVTGQTAAEIIYDRADAGKPTMGLTTWKDAPDGKILKRDVGVAKNYLNEKEMSRLNRLVTMFIDYAELMAEDETLMSMQDWLDQTNRFLTNNRRKVLEGKGHVSHDEALVKAEKEYEVFRVRQDREYISEFDRQTEKYLKGE